MEDSLVGEMTTCYLDWIEQRLRVVWISDQINIEVASEYKAI